MTMGSIFLGDHLLAAVLYCIMMKMLTAMIKVMIPLPLHLPQYSSEDDDKDEAIGNVAVLCCSR